MTSKTVFIFLVLLLAFAISFFSCSKDEGDDHWRKGEATDDDTGVLDGQDDDTADDDDDEDDDDNHWPDDDDDDDDDVDDDDDDDVDDDDDDGDQIYGMVVGENNDQDSAFLGVVSSNRILRKTVPFSDDVRLNAIDYISPDHGITVGTDTSAGKGMAWLIDGDLVTGTTLPIFTDSWGLEDVDLVEEDEAFMVGFISEAKGYRGIILHYSDGLTTQMETPSIAGGWRLLSVSFFSSTRGWAVGFNEGTDKAIILGYNGFAWSQMDLPASLTTSQLLHVDAPSAFFALAMGSQVATGDLITRGLALYFDGVEWRQTFLFPGDGLLWYFTNVDILSLSSAKSYLVKHDRLEKWSFDGSTWTRGTHNITFPAGSIATGLSLADSGNGLLGIRNIDGSSGMVMQMLNSFWSEITDYPEAMGNIYDVVTIKME